MIFYKKFDIIYISNDKENKKKGKKTMIRVYAKNYTMKESLDVAFEDLTPRAYKDFEYVFTTPNTDGIFHNENVALSRKELIEKGYLHRDSLNRYFIYQWPWTDYDEYYDAYLED